MISAGAIAEMQRGRKTTCTTFTGANDVFLETVPGWTKTAGGIAGKGRIKNNNLAVVAGLDTAYTFTGGSSNQRSASATLLNVTDQQGFVAPVIIDEYAFVGTTYVPAPDVSTPAVLRAATKLGTVVTILGEVEQVVASGERIGGIVYDGNYYITYEDAVIGGPYVI